MKKLILHILAGLAAVPLLLVACGTQSTPEDESTTQENSEMTQIQIETEAEPEPLPYLIPYPTRVNLAMLDEKVFGEAFARGTATKVQQTEQGLVITGAKESRSVYCSRRSSTSW